MLVVLWATVAVLGGAVYLAKHAGPPDAGGPAKAGLGLCAVSVALLAGRAARRVAIPSLASEVRPAFAASPTVAASARLPLRFTTPPTSPASTS